MKQIKQTVVILFNIIIFVTLNSFAFALSPLFGLLFVLGFIISIYNKDIRRKPWKTSVIFLGGLITRFALGNFLSVFQNSEHKFTLDFAVAVVMLALVFIAGWKLKRK